MGRPKLSEDEKKGQITGVRLRDEERQLLETKARSEGKTLSAWMRDAVVKTADTPVVAAVPEQSEFLFDGWESTVLPSGHTTLWTPRDIWVHLNQRYLGIFKEDRRIEFKESQKSRP